MFAMLSSILTIPLVLVASVVAQGTPSVVCVAGQCLEGFSNITIGAKLSASGAPTSILLLPGQYTSTTNPELLHSLLTSSSAKLTPSSGFENASVTTLPLNLELSPGLAIYSQSHYSGQTGFSQLPSAPVSNSSTPLSASSLALSTNIWAAVSSGSSSNRIVLWEAVPDITQLPLTASGGSLSLLDLQSAACSPPCSGSGICSASGTCTCPKGFTGSSCETCASGFFGPTCQACPAGCPSCDDGISGSGRCLTSVLPSNAPSTCNCLNGVCGSNGQCSCNAGWTTGTNGTACAKCEPGFFLTSTGDCKVCTLGCSQCADITGSCTACKTGFTQNPSDTTKCNPVQQATTTGSFCPDGSFSIGASCSLCSSSCRTCNGATSNDCILCASGQYSFNGSCVSANANGVCAGSNLIADNNKNECDTCGAKCTSCQIPNFTGASIVTQLQCTACLPGFFLSQGQCVASCPSGTFVSPQDNLTCIACDASCSSCAGTSTFCLSCPSGLFASGGKCVSACPTNAFTSTTSKGICTTCHPDCATCSGGSFTQCSSCPPSRPVLTNGRCLPTCSKSQYFDKTTSSCQSCDSSCSSCSGSGPSNCLACSSSTQVLRAGTCVAANCNGASNVIAGLGVCLSELVQVPAVTGTGTGTAAPLPTVTGLGDPTVITTSARRPLAWWEILLMALGCAFIFVMFVMCWRRRARKQREKRTKEFAAAKRLDEKKNWRWRLVRFGEKLFGHEKSRKGGAVHAHTEMRMRGGAPADSVRYRDDDLGDIEEARHTLDVENFIDSYDYSTKSRSSRGPSVLPPLHGSRSGAGSRMGSPRRGMDRLQEDAKHSNNRLSSHSLYSEVTGIPRHTPEPRQPIKTQRNLTAPSTRFSGSTFSSTSRSEKLLVDWDSEPVPRLPTDAERYAMEVRPRLAAPVPQPYEMAQPLYAHGGGSYWMQPTHTGSSGSGSRNPFRQ